MENDTYDQLGPSQMEFLSHLRLPGGSVRHNFGGLYKFKVRGSKIPIPHHRKSLESSEKKSRKGWNKLELN